MRLSTSLPVRLAGGLLIAAATVNGLAASVSRTTVAFRDRWSNAELGQLTLISSLGGKQFQDALPVSRGVGTGSRRAMPIVGSGHSPWLFWDGRKDSLWSQALGPLEDAVEHGGTRSRYAHLLQSHYRSDYEAIFGAMPDLAAVSTVCLPTSAS